MVGLNMDGPSRDRVLRLMEEKDRIEREIREQTAVLETNQVGMQDPLVDGDGYPRSDVDVYRVRHARHRIICLQNDHKAIMKRIEQGLTEVHAQALGPHGEGLSEMTTTSNGTNGHSDENGHISDNIQRFVQVVTVNDREFAVVSFVFDGSPADIAGLNVADEIMQFGSINHTNFRDMPQIYDLVAHSVGQNIQVKVRRQQHVLNLTVVPRPWAQPGLLGCQIRRL